jgi:Fe-S cluster biogenesis protein NfuA
MAESTSPTPPDTAPDTPERPEDRIRSLLEQIRPFLQRDGGDLEYISYESGTVSLRLQGACTSCPSSTMTLKMGIERALKEHVPEVEQVVTVD